MQNLSKTAYKTNNPTYTLYIFQYIITHKFSFVQRIYNKNAENTKKFAEKINSLRKFKVYYTNFVK